MQSSKASPLERPCYLASRCYRGQSSLWSFSWLRNQMFYPCVMISAAQACESDGLSHAMSPFSLFLSSFSGLRRILGYLRPRRIAAVRPPKRGIRIHICGLHLEEPFNWDNLHNLRLSDVIVLQKRRADPEETL